MTALRGLSAMPLVCAYALRPDQSAFPSIGALAALAAAMCYALSNGVGRIISRTEPSATLVFWTTASMALGGPMLSALKWVDVLPEHWPPLLGLAGGAILIASGNYLIRREAPKDMVAVPP